MMFINTLLSVLFFIIFATTQAYPAGGYYEVSNNPEDTVVFPVINDPERRPILRDAASFAALRQLRSEDYVPLYRRFRGIINSASRPDESGLDSDFKRRGSNSGARTYPQQPVVVNEETHIETSQQPTIEDSNDGAKVRAKKSERSFKYLPMRG